jgi:GTP-dependent phosphoenolpyruvate carboxykinase
MSESINNEILAKLKVHLGELITLFERTKEENITLFNENQKLVQTIKQKQEEIIKLQDKLETYKVSNAFVITSDGKDIAEKKHDAKIRINRIVKEIDKCISLLNK